MDINKFLRNIIYWKNKMMYPGSVMIEGKFDYQSLEANDILREIGVIISKKAKSLGLTSAEKRGAKNLSKIANDVRIEQGYMLASVFFNIQVVRDKITTKIVDGIELDDFSMSPYELDYGVSPDNLKYTIEEALKLRLKLEEARQIVCSVTTKNADEVVGCPKCDGSGSLRCESCGGSGREQYVDGIYASGEERIKTGQCSNCYGSGKIKCDTCNGSGKREFFSNQYQIIKSFEDVKVWEGYGCISRSWLMEFIDDCNFPKDSGGHFLSNNPTFLSVWNNAWREFSNQELECGIEKLHKNQKEILVDNATVISNEISLDYKRLYEQNKKSALRYFDSSKISKQGKLGCFIEKHIEIPVTLFYYSIDGYESVITIFENDNENANGETMCCFDNMPELGFFKSLF